LLCGDIVTPTFTYADGSLAVPAGPGLGIDLDPDLLLRYTATQP
jgi:L-alanine-DL-glutamate epimerase-like enolase superfamily enzyme